MKPTFRTKTHLTPSPGKRFLLGFAGTIALITLGACATLPEGVERVPSYALGAGSGTLSEHARTAASAHPGKAGFMLLDTGLDAFVARAVLARKAERSIDAQYYLFHDDMTGRLFTSELLDAADRGVRVRLLVDDIDYGGRELNAAILSRHPNIEMRLFNPFGRGWPRVVQFATRFGQITRRMHNKSFTVDNAVTVVGGRNIGDEYFDAAPRMNFSDLDALVIGPVVAEVSASFDEYWNHELSYPAEALNRHTLDTRTVRARLQKLRDPVETDRAAVFNAAVATSPLAGALKSDVFELDWGNARLISDSPEKLVSPRIGPGYHLGPELGELFSGTGRDLVIISAYFIPGKPGVAFLSDLAARGVRVRILTNSLASTDVPIVHAGYARYRKALLRAGIELYEASPHGPSIDTTTTVVSGSSAASLHAKSFVFDRQLVYIGSLNLDPRSVHENTEIGVVLDSTRIAADILEWFDDFTASSAYRLALEESQSGRERVTWTEANDDGRVWTREPERGPLARLGVLLLRLLPIESQL